MDLIEVVATISLQGLRVGAMALDGTDEREDFDSSDGTGDMVYPFTGGDGWVTN